MLDLETRIKKSHVTLMRHPETALYSGVIMMGTSEVVDSGITAYTDGINKRYGRAFMNDMSDLHINGIVLHENLHVALRHVIHGRKMFAEDRRTANMAADYVVNGIIANLKDKTLCALPDSALLDPKYFDWSMVEVYKDLRKKKEEGEEKRRCKEGNPNEGGGSNSKGNPATGSGVPDDNDDDGSYPGGFDEHDFDPKDSDPEGAGSLSAEEISEAVDRALREGAILAGRFGADIPRAISESLEPVVDWKEELSEFISNAMSGKDEYTWRKYNRRVIDTMLLPTTISETVGEIIVPIDTSGSIGGRQLAQFAGELASICEMVSPERVRVLWWDTSVHAEQIFEEGQYADIAKLLKPRGGGGTRVSCVSEYITKNNLTADAVVVFTDGFVEDRINWSINVPTLWLVTQNRSFAAPGDSRVVRFP